MSFSFVVENGTGLSNATSYASVADADAYFVIDRVFCETWAAINPTDKEYRLAWATRILDQKVRWNGIKTVEDSALSWPRSGVCDRNGIPIDSGVIPTQLKQALFELAKYITSEDVTTGRGVDYIKRLTLDVLEVEYMDDSSQSSFPSIIPSILRGLGTYAVPGGFSFGRIVKT